MNANEIVLIDLSSIAYPIYLMSAAEPDPNKASQSIVARIRTLAAEHPHAAICCDAGRSFRHDIATTYKANRPEREEALHHQITLAKEQLAADGFPVWSVKSFEADDLIATAVTRALTMENVTVLIVSADKDLLQLVGPRVRAKSARDGSIADETAVGAKFGVLPTQMRDYLCLVGDAADNVKGAKGIGPKKAGELLARFGSLDAVYAGLAEKGAAAMGIPPAMAASLREFQADLPVTRQLITLRTDVEIPFEEVGPERTPKAAAGASGDSWGVEDLEPDEPEAEPVVVPPAAVQPAMVEQAAPSQGAQSIVVPAAAAPVEQPSQALAVREAEVLMPAPAEWERQLDPRSLRDARVIAKDMFDSHMFSAYGNAPAVLSTIMVGRELGLPAMASLRSIHVIEGRHGLSAQLMVATVLRSGLAEFFEPISFSDTEATYETKRKGARNPVQLTHTIEMARKAWKKTADAWEKSGWGANPTDMLCARASARLARMIYPDILAGLYTPEELAELRESLAA